MPYSIVVKLMNGSQTILNEYKKIPNYIQRKLLKDMQVSYQIQHIGFMTLKMILFKRSRSLSKTLELNLSKMKSLQTITQS